MKASIRGLLGAVSLFILTITAAQAGDLEDRAEIRQKFATDFLQYRFDDLNATANEYRKNQARTSSGIWELAAFYAGQEYLYASALTDKDWDRLSQIAQKWVDEKPSPAAYNVYADILFYRSWHMREPEYFNKAQDYFMAHKAESSIDPEWYRTMIELSASSDMKEADITKLFAEAIEKHKYYYDIYFRVVWHLMHKNAPAAELENFANVAVENTKEQEGVGIYTRIYWYASQIGVGGSSDIFKTTDVRWDRMKLGMDDVLKKYPDQWNINNFAFFSCMMKDQKMTKTLMDRIETPIASAWHNTNDIYKSCQSWSHTPPP